jgi:hypothetical protein
MPEKKPRTVGTLVVTAGLAIALAGCNGNDAALPTAPTATGRGGDRVVLSRTFGDVEPGGTRSAAFYLPRSGDLNVQVTWTSEDNSVAAYILGLCAGPRRFDTDCRLRGSMERPQRENRISTHGEPGDYQVLIQNEGPGAESISVTVRATDDDVVPGPGPDPGRNQPGRGRDH